MATGGTALAQGHLAWGALGCRFYQDVLRGFDELFWNREERTAELRGIRGHWHMLLAKAALHAADREQALHSLRAASEELGDVDANTLRLLVTIVPHGRAVRALYGGWLKLLAGPAAARARARRTWRAVHA
jgi:hypothetical protein